MSFCNEVLVNEYSVILGGASTGLEEGNCVVFLFQALSMCLDCVLLMMGVITTVVLALTACEEDRCDHTWNLSTWLHFRITWRAFEKNRATSSDN